LKSLGDNIFVAGSSGIKIFKEDLGTVTLKNNIDGWNIRCIELWEDRNLLFAIESFELESKDLFNLLVFDLRLNLTKSINFGQSSETKHQNLVHTCNP
jgi:hypothetical protein